MYRLISYLVKYTSMKILFFSSDLTSSDRQSEHFLKKLNRARFALARTDSIRSVSGSLLNKPPYRRATSIPIHLQGKSMSKGNSMS